MSVNLTILDESYKVKVGAEVYSVDYPSFEDAQKIAKDFKSIGEDSDKAISLMKEWLIKLGLSEDFFSLKTIKARHIMEIWKGINSVKK